MSFGAGVWVAIAVTLVTIAALIATLGGKAREQARTDALVRALAAKASGGTQGRVDLGSLPDLPAPVARYFRHVLTPGQATVTSATMRQSGVLRTGVNTERWCAFTADQLVVPPAPGFAWDARVEMALAMRLRVVDSYDGTAGAGRVSFLSAFAVASECGTPELNAGALHRYLAEAVWYPTALLPASGVAWTAIDERRALATVAHHGTTVSLEFRFNEAGEVEGIYTPGRFGRFAGAYRQLPWEGHFRDYRETAGMRVPRYGEVGWHVDGRLRLVWKGEVIDAKYELGRAAAGPTAIEVTARPRQ